MTAPYRVTSLATLRRIPVGTRLILVWNLRGSCYRIRTVAKVQTKQIALACEELGGQLSWLQIPSASALRFDDRGFTVIASVAPDGTETIGARYEYTDGAA